MWRARPLSSSCARALLLASPSAAPWRPGARAGASPAPSQHSPLPLAALGTTPRAAQKLPRRSSPGDVRKSPPWVWIEGRAPPLRRGMASAARPRAGELLEEKAALRTDVRRRLKALSPELRAHEGGALVHRRPSPERRPWGEAQWWPLSLLAAQVAQ